MPQTQLEMSRGLLKKIWILTSLGSHSRLEATAFDELGMRLKYLLSYKVDLETKQVKRH